MTNRRFVALTLAVTLWLGGRNAAEALTLEAGGISGVMQQPTSQYYHGIYGGYADFGSDDQRFLIRGCYMERPRFVAAGYADQEWGGFGFLGTKVTKTENHGIVGLFGYGRMNGVQSVLDRDSVTDGSSSHRTYSMGGPSVALEYFVRFSRVEVALNHQTFMGYAGKAQTEAYVAWPYTFFVLRLGFRI